MDTLRIARWLVRVDAQRTAEAHAALSSGGATECRCDGCKNFEAVRPQLLRGPLGDVLRQLGVRPPFEVEAFEQGRAASGLHHYGGWFHFVGEIVSGRPAWKSTDGSSNFSIADFEPLSESVSIGLRGDAALVRAPFQGLSLVQLDFHAELPWVIDAPDT